jgi:hypothetical protein
MPKTITPTHATKARTYNAASLSIALEHFECRYDMTTPAFLDAYQLDDPVPGVPAFECHVWASFAEDVRRLGHASP